MGMQSIPILTLTIRATGVIAAHRFVTFAGAQAGAGVASFGVTRTAAAVGDLVSVDKKGTTVCEAGAAVTAGDLVQSDASGRAITKAAGIAIGRALEAATAAGQFIEVELIDNPL